MNTKTTSPNLRYLVILALFIGIELMMKIMGLGSVPVGPLVMSFLTVPIAVGAILLGPGAGAVLGAVFGLASLYDAITGTSAMTGFFFANVSRIHTIILCVATRTLMGACVGWIFKGLEKIDRTKTVCYFLASLSAALLNTLFFMGYIVIFFYNTEFVQNLVAAKGASNAFMFVILLVGVQGLIEAVACTIVGGGVSKGVAAALKKSKYKIPTPTIQKTPASRKEKEIR